MVRQYGGGQGDAPGGRRRGAAAGAGAAITVLLKAPEGQELVPPLLVLLSPSPPPPPPVRTLPLSCLNERPCVREACEHGLSRGGRSRSRGGGSLCDGSGSGASLRCSVCGCALSGAAARQRTRCGGPGAARAAGPATLHEGRRLRAAGIPCAGARGTDVDYLHSSCLLRT